MSSLKEGYGGHEHFVDERKIPIHGYMLQGKKGHEFILCSTLDSRKKSPQNQVGVEK